MIAWYIIEAAEGPLLQAQVKFPNAQRQPAANALNRQEHLGGMAPAFEDLLGINDSGER